MLGPDNDFETFEDTPTIHVLVDGKSEMRRIVIRDGRPSPETRPGEHLSICSKEAPVDHKITTEEIPNGKDSNLNVTRALCSCGWKGEARYAYNDDRDLQVQRDGEWHLKDIDRAFRTLETNLIDLS